MRLRRVSEIGGSAAVRRVGWGVLDQALSSLTNFAVSIAVVRAVSVSDFGAFSLAFAAYAIALGLSRALTTEPLVVRYSGKLNDRSAERSALGASVLFGLVAGSICALIGLVIPGSYRSLLFALAVVLPGLLLQDAWRVVFFVRGKGRNAFLNDLVWALALVPALLLVANLGATAATVTLGWGIAGNVAALAGLAQARMQPAMRSSWAWIRKNWDLTSRYVVETAALSGTQQLYFLLTGVIAGLAAVGQLKLVLVVLGPVNIIIQGIGIAALPEVVKASGRSIRRMDVAVTGVSGVLALGALLWGLIVLLLPTSVLVGIAGPSWSSTAALVLPLVLLQVLNGANTGAYMGLRAMRRVNLGLQIRIFSSLSFIVLAIVGALMADATGAAWGLAIAALLNLVCWLLGYGRARQSFLPSNHDDRDSIESAIE